MSWNGSGANGPVSFALWDQLPPHLRNQLEEVPLQVRKPVVEFEATLEEQVRQFVNRRVHELESFAEAEVRKHTELLAWRDNVRRNEEREALKPKLKSIVKQRPSVPASEKRVSFSNSPPKVEVFETDDNAEEEDGIHSKDSSPTLTPEDSPESVVFHHAPLVSKPKHDLATVPVKPDTATFGTDPVFSFDDIISQEAGDTPKGEDEKLMPDKASPDFSPEPENSRNMEGDYVGSLPIDISSNHVAKNRVTRGLDFDDKIPKEVDSFDISPERMSFSQRMIWESQKSS